MPFQYHTVLFSENLRPNVHFIPVNSDGSDLLDKINWCIQHPQQAQQIVMNGKSYISVHRNNMNETVIAKMVRMYPFVNNTTTTTEEQEVTSTDTTVNTVDG